MINNGSLRTSKGVRSNDALKTDDDKSGQKLDKEKSRTSSNQYHGYKNVRYSSSGNRLIIENRQRDDHKMARGSYTRKTTRGASKREYETYGSRRKLSEASKEFSSSEDTRISKTLRRMVREENPDTFSTLCTQLQESITLAENERYIRKAMEFICESILDMLHSGSCYHTKLMAAKCLSHLAIALECDARRFFDWIFTKYFEERNLEVRSLFMQGIHHMLVLDKGHVLADFAPLLIGQVQNILENAEIPELVLITGRIFHILMEEYIEIFEDFFKDTVDILVGWHIDIEQSQSVIRVMSDCLQSLLPYWISDLTFTVSLLGQLLEDMERYANDYRQICVDYASLSEADTANENEKERHSLRMDSLRSLAKTMSFMKVFNAITKTVGQYLSPNSSPTFVSWNFLIDSLTKVVRTILLCMQTENMDEELIITGNEGAWLLISLMQCKLNPGQDTLCKLVQLQLKNAPSYRYYTVASMLQLISKIVKEGSANLPENLIGDLLGPESYILKLRFATNMEVHKGVVAVYQSLLNLKNIPLLQEAYRFILGDLENAYLIVDPDAKPFCADNPHLGSSSYSFQEAHAVVLFHVKALSDLANAGGSIIGMWVLQPCILELLAVKLRPIKPDMNPSIRYAILFLLYAHCLRYSNFVSSSELVASIQGRTNVRDLLRIMGSDITPTSSPTSGHLSIILNTLTSLLKINLDYECTMLVLKWCGVIFNNAQTYLSSLLTTKEFTALMEQLIYFGGRSTEDFAVGVVLDDLLILLANKNHWESKSNLRQSIVELCFIHLNAANSSIGVKCKQILTHLPWSIVMSVLRNVSKREGPFNRLASICKSHMNRGTNGEMQSQHFKLFLSFILKNSPENEMRIFKDSFYNCWNSAETKTTFENVAPVCKAALLFWQTWECAQYCVANKLRTTLGKPQDTFMAIEGALKMLARETTHKHAETESNFTLRRVRLLLEFVEQLEKSICNASDGTAAALPAASKPVRTFFHTNKSTCAEWLARIRLIIVMVALNTGCSTTAVRHGFCLLQDLVNSGNTKGPEFENAIMHVSWALYSLKECEAIEGLYAWCLNTLDMTFPFLKALADQAAGKYETALETYLHLVDETDEDEDSLTLKTSELTLSESVRSSDTMSDSLKSLLADQITECYLDLNDWTQLKEWKKKEADFLTTVNGSCVQRYSHVTVKEANLYCELELGNYSSVNALMDWTTVSKSNDKLTSGWNSRHLLNEMKQNLLEKFVASYSNENAYKENVASVLGYANMIDLTVADDLRNLPSPLIEDFTTLMYVTSAFLHESETSPNNFTLDLKGKGLDSKRLAEALWWTKIIDRHRGNEKRVNTSELCLQLIKSARKEGNTQLASRQLLSHFEKVFSALGTVTNLDNGRKTFNVLLETITNQSKTATTALWSADNTDALMELSKLAYSYQNQELAIEICAMSALGIAQNGDIADSLIRDKTTSLLLKLSKWLSKETACMDSSLPYPSYTTISTLLTLLKHNVTVTATSNNGSTLDVMRYDFSNSLIRARDLAVGNLLQISVVQSPSHAKAWNRFGDWCYSRGRSVLDKPSSALTPEDKEIIDGFIPTDVVSKEMVYEILTHHKPAHEEEDIETDRQDATELIEWQLRSAGHFKDDQIAGLIDIWRSIHAQNYACYHLAAQSYFKYLQISDFKENSAEIVTVTLRLLRLIVRHSREVQNIFESELTFTPTTPWKCIIPQLFSRLSHPEPYVRRRISELLSRLAEDAPHLITFPAVVGSDSGATGTINNMPTSKLFKSCMAPDSEIDAAEIIQDEDDVEEEDDDEVSQDDQGRVLENCYLGMVDTLAKQAPDTISQVQLLVNELRRITLLWDELWLGALTQHYTDMARRISQLSNEIARVDANRHLSDAEKDSFVSEKYTVFLRPILYILEQLQAITSVKPETPHEQWFQKTFEENIASTINTLQNPKDPRKPQEAWKMVKTLQFQFQRRASKRSSYSLKMSDISPALAALKNTSIAMPGVEEYITVASVHNQVTVLPTKTKPKKLVFRGSDGKMYTYLFKGLEDLHLDERIMQFLTIANTMLKESGYQARHYSVIPLGPRSGLISWVDHVTPIFALYKRWQQREALINNQNSVMRPSALFYSKLTPLLKEHGITNLENRKEWPLTVLVQVLQTLMKETPDNLLAKELWCQSVNTGAWWKSLHLYSTSLAVMSVIGYIIGLGDRHLDNVLVHLTTGEVVHIDYNVCFEKGKTLRVPEKVPFRMTPNLRAALGVTGVEGIFRLTCERVMKVLKRGRETLLTLLEAFVYDPLIDWTPGIETGYTGAVYGGGRALALKNKHSRKQLEQEVTTTMFTIRVAEIRADWLENRDKTKIAVSQLCSNIEKWIKSEEKLATVMDSLAKSSQQLEILKAAAAHPQHHLYSLHTRYQSRKEASDAMIKAQIGLKQKLEDCDAQLTQYKLLFYHLRGEQLPQWLSELNKLKDQDHKIFDVITDFLKSTGVNQLINQCLVSEKELNEATNEQVPFIVSCLDMLKKYSMVSSLYPASSLLQHRCASYKRWIHMMLEFPSPNVCDKILSEFNLLYVVPVGNENIAQQATSFAENLHQHIVEMEYSLKTRLEKLEKSTSTSSESETDIIQMEQTIEMMSENMDLTLQCAVINELCQLNKRFLKMETAALGAGNCLMVLTTMDGEWFLDDMCLMTEVSIKLASYILNPSLLENNSGIHLVTKCLDLLHGIYKRLQEMNVNFSTIILPETMKKLLVEDETVLDMISKLNLIISSCSLPLPELIKELQTHLRYIIMGMPSPHPNSVKVAEELRRNFNALINERNNSLSNVMTEGQMLLMGFNVLFSNIFKQTSDLFSLLPALAMTNTTWNSVDLIKDTRSLIGPVFNKESQGLLQDIFLLKYINTMHEFFCKCQLTAAAYRGGLSMPTVYHSDEELNKLVKKFTADYLSQQLLGLFSYTFATTIGLFLQHIGFNIIAEVEQRDIGAESKVPMEELCQKAIEQQRQRDAITNSGYSHALSLLGSLQVAWKRIAANKKLAVEIQAQELMIQKMKLQYNTHRWLHDDLLSAKTLPAPLIDRADFLADMRAALQSLITSQLSISQRKEQQESLIANARMRLKWAAGSNPSLSEVVNVFEDRVKLESDSFTRNQQLVNTIVSMCSCVLQYEALRVQTPETLMNDSQFVLLVNNYKDACNMVMSLATANFTPEEENLVQLLPPSTPIDIKWINEADALISDSIKKFGQELESLKNFVSETRDEVKSMATSLRVLLSDHYKILVDVRSLLKSMMKFEDVNGSNDIPEYLLRHKTFCEQLNALTKELSTTELTETKGRIALKQLPLIQQQIDYIYDQILKFSMEKEPSKAKRPPLLRQESVHLSPKKRMPHDPRTGKVLQERNQYAINVWRRVRMKLDGRDPDHTDGLKLPVQEQVDKIIGDATNIENLALLYEGWTPWV